MKSRVLAYTISNAASPARLERLRSTLTEGRATAGIREFDWIAYANTPQVAEVAVTIPGIVVRGDGVNVGQHVAQREILRLARCDNPTFKHGVDDVMSGHKCTPTYDFLLRIDDDCEWLTKGWLKRLLDVYDRASNGGRYPFILAPKVSGLKHPIESHGIATPGGVKLHLVEILGGVCRLMPVAAIESWQPDVREALGAGDAIGFAQAMIESKVPMFVTPWVRIRHQTAAHEAEDAEWSVAHDIAQRIPYVPDYVDAPQELRA